MKKTFILLAIIALSTSLFSQNGTIPDGSFEDNWVLETASSGDYWEYSSDLFMTLNILYQVNDSQMSTEVTSFRETDAQDGNYAVKVISRPFAGGMIFVPGAFGTVSENFVEEFLSEQYINVIREFTFNFKPIALTGYYKYTPVAGDSAAIDMAFYNNNGNNEIASSIFIEYNAVSEWTPFYINTNLSQDDPTPTHLKLLFVSSAGYDFVHLENCVGQENSSFYFDNVAFVYPDGLVEPLMSSANVDVYPIPASSVVNFDLAHSVNGKLVIYNLLGQEIDVVSINGDMIHYSIDNLSEGNYLYRIIEGSTILKSGKFSVNR